MPVYSFKIEVYNKNSEYAFYPWYLVEFYTWELLVQWEAYISTFIILIKILDFLYSSISSILSSTFCFIYLISNCTEEYVKVSVVLVLIIYAVKIMSKKKIYDGMLRIKNTNLLEILIRCIKTFLLYIIYTVKEKTKGEGMFIFPSKIKQIFRKMTE